MHQWDVLQCKIDHQRLWKYLSQPFSAVFLPPLFVNCAHVPLRENSPDSVSVWHGFYGLCRFAVHFVSHRFVLFFSVVTLNGLAVWSRICAGGRSCFKDSLHSLQTRLVCPSCIVLKLYQKMLTWWPKSVVGPKSKGFEAVGLCGNVTELLKQKKNKKQRFGHTVVNF